MIHISKAIIEIDGKFLLLKRATTSYPGTWDFAGGKDDPDETHEESVVRETKEETNYKILPDEEVKTIEYIGEDRRVMFHYFMLKKIEGKFLISQDHSDRMWATKGEIEEMDLHPSVALYFDL
jgi:ADP-ribose pyrophosphatase YjhB (NUDIX family)